MTAEPILLMTLVDAWRHDACTPDRVPFLHHLRQRGAGGALVETFGFNTGPAIFAGVHPAVSNQIHKFWFSPETTPYGFTRFIPEFLLRLPRGSGRIDGWIHRRAEANARARGVTAARHLVDFRGVPHRLRRFFDLAEVRNPYEAGYVPARTIFDVLREHGRSYAWIGVPDHALTVESNCADFGISVTGKETLVFVHWAEPDWVGHAHGPASEEYSRVLQDVDRAIERLVVQLRGTGRPVVVLAFGDHGLAPVTRRVDVAAALAGLDATCPRDYVYFLDSTAARFWFVRDARREVEEALGRLGSGRILTDGDADAYRLPKGDRRHWDLCWVTDGGVIITPDFFHSTASAEVRGMHGYRPEVVDNRSAWVLGGDLAVTRSEGTTRSLVDVMPTALEVLGLPVPASCQGTSLLRDAPGG